MKSRSDIQAELDHLHALVNDEEPETYNDRDQEQEWTCIHTKIDVLNWVLRDEAEV